VNPLPRHLASTTPVSCLSFQAARFLGFTPTRFVLAPLSSLLPILAHDGSAAANRSASAPVLDSIDCDAICSKRASEWRAAGAERGRAPPAWIVPLASDWEPNPPYGYIVSFVWLHERDFTTPVSRFMRGLCYHYGVELHNFAPIAISQVAAFVGVCEGFLGIPVNWDLWVHLFLR
jgi:hypothetical protein